MRQQLLLALAQAHAVCGEPLDVMVLGDWGGQAAAPYWTDPQVENTEGMAAYAAARPPRFGWLLGDNFYDRGIRCDDSKDPRGWARAWRARRECTEDAFNYRFQETFEKVMDDPALDFPMYAIVGNHDHYGNVSAQVEYGALGRAVPGASGRWQFPVSDNDIEHTWYSHTESFEAPNGESVTAEFFMLDTVRWAGLCNSDSSGFRRGRYWRQNMTERSLAQAVGGTRRYAKAYESCGGDKCCIYTEWGASKDVACREIRHADWGFELEMKCELENSLTQFADAQRRWLEQALSSSSAQWKVVVGHYPVWSVSGHGPTPRLLKELEPLLLRYNVAMYYNGHDHSAQHIQHNQNLATEYFNIGAGSPVTNSRTQEHTLFYGAQWDEGDSTGRSPVPPRHYHTWTGDENALKFFCKSASSELQSVPADRSATVYLFCHCRSLLSGTDGDSPGAYTNGGTSTPEGHNASFATIRFFDAETAQVDIVNRHGCVVYRFNKVNPNTASTPQQPVASGIRSALPCYTKTGHTPAAVEQFRQAKRDVEFMGWILPLLVGIVGGAVLSSAVHRYGCCGCSKKHGYKKTQSNTDEELGKLTRDSTSGNASD